MKTGALFGWGIVIYAVMFLAWSLCVAYGFTSGILPRLACLLVLIITATIAGRSLRFNNARDVALYSFTWMLVVIALDAVFAARYSGFDMFFDWNVWFGYALVLLVPLGAPYTRKGLLS